MRPRWPLVVAIGSVVLGGVVIASSFDPAAVDRPKSEKRCTGSGHWVGTGHQFDIDMTWTIDMTIDLSKTKVGALVGTIVYPSLGCSGELYRMPDVDGNPVVNERLDHNPNHVCVDDGSIRLTCKGAILDYRWFYPSLEYGAHAELDRAP